MKNKFYIVILVALLAGGIAIFVSDKFSFNSTMVNVSTTTTSQVANEKQPSNQNSNGSKFVFSGKILGTQGNLLNVEVVQNLTGELELNKPILLNPGSCQFDKTPNSFYVFSTVFDSDNAWYTCTSVYTPTFD